MDHAYSFLVFLKKYLSIRGLVLGYWLHPQHIDKNNDLVVGANKFLSEVAWVMSQQFTFPPPPPPPPKPSPNRGTYQQQNARGSYRGRGGVSAPQQNNRGGNARGRYSPRGSYGGGGHGSRGNSLNHTNPGHSFSSQSEVFQSASSHHPSQRRQSNGDFNPGQKRPHSAAFNNQANSNYNATKPRPLAPPPVPSFGVDFNALLPKKPELPNASNLSTSSSTVKKANLLGLTPAIQTPGQESESESDTEEESRLASSLSTNPNALTFEHNGQASSLSTPEEIASWIAERRKRWPTEAKREVARQQAEDRRKKYQAEKAARLEASKAAAKARQAEREKQRVEKEKSLVRQKLLREQIAKAGSKAKEKECHNTGATQSAAQIKADRLRKKAARIAQKLKLAESALQKETPKNPSDPQTEAVDSDQTPENNVEVDETDVDALLAQVDKIAAEQQDLVFTNTLATLDNETNSISSSASDSDLDPADDTSTSGSSSASSDSDSSDSDSPPDQLSSKQPIPSTAPPIPKSHHDTRPLCTNYTRTGRCKFGRRCHFRHEKPTTRQAAGQTKEGARRKGLYQVMVEKEVERERRRAVQVIIGLGEAGWLDQDGDGSAQVTGKAS